MGGRGGGVRPDFILKLDFEIAVDQKTRAGDRNFAGLPTGSRGTATPIFGQFLAQFCQITLKNQNHVWGTLLVATKY